MVESLRSVTSPTCSLCETSSKAAWPSGPSKTSSTASTTACPERPLTHTLAHQLRPGGRLIVGDDLIGHDIQPALSLTMDWFPIERSLEDISALAAAPRPASQADAQTFRSDSISDQLLPSSMWRMSAI